MLSRNTEKLRQVGANSRKSMRRYRYNVSLPKIQEQIRHQALFSKQPLDRSFQKQNQSEINNEEEILTTKYSWIHSKTNYDELSENDLIHENVKLKQHIYQINKKVDVFLKQAKTKTKTKFRVKTMTQQSKEHNFEVKKQQIVNNNIILSMYANQYRTLKLREKKIHDFGKAGLDKSIEEMKTQLDETKTKNKKLRQKNRTLGDSIFSVDTLFEQIHQLEKEKQIQAARKTKLQKKIQQSNEAMRQMDNKLERIRGQHDLAETYLKKNALVSQSQTENRKNSDKLTQKQHLYELLKKKVEAAKLVKQQSYHNSLKTLENIIEKTKNTEKQIAQKQLEIIQSREILYELTKKAEKKKEKVKYTTEIMIKTNSMEKQPFELKSQISSIHEDLSNNTETKKEDKIFIDQNF